MKDIHAPIESIEDDKLERVEFAERILYRLTENDCPPTLGILGSWGTGKSSVVNLIIKLNKKKRSKKLHLELFDAWKYEGTGNLFIPIIARLNKSLPKKVKKSADQIVKITSLFLLDIILKKATNVSINDVDAYLEESKKSLNEWDTLIDEIEHTNSYFEDLVNNFLQNQDSKKLVIFIDNLDRCSPENTLHLLESIKNFFFVENCVWVFSLDDEVIASYISQKYQGARIDGRGFLDKIISEQYHIPTFNSFDLGNLFWDKIKQEIHTFDIKLDRTNYLFTPRKIVRVGVKFKQFLQRDSLSKKFTDKQKEFLFGLIFIYYSWPDFYTFLSSGNKDQLSGVLANFYEGVGGTSVTKIQLPNKFQDKDLFYFVQTWLIKNTGVTISIGDSEERYTEDIIMDLLLRLSIIGLP